MAIDESVKTHAFFRKKHIADFKRDSKSRSLMKYMKLCLYKRKGGITGEIQVYRKKFSCCQKAEPYGFYNDQFMCCMEMNSYQWITKPIVFPLKRIHVK